MASEFDAGANDGAQPTAQQAAGEAASTGAGRSTSAFINLPLVTVLFPDSLQDGADEHGGYDLQRGDNDAQRRWAGVGPVDAANPPTGSHVQQLQQDLVELGFAILGDPDGDFGRTTEWAVRKFQIYAKMRFLAIQATADPRYLAGLELNLHHYAGPISGVVNVGNLS